MAAVTINGFDIPTAATGGKRAFQEVGGRTTSGVTGTERISRRGLHAPATLATPPLDAQTADAVRKWICGVGDYWDWSVDVYSAAGLGPSAGYVAPLRPLEGYFAGSGAIAVEAGTTNLIPLANQQFASWTAQSGAAITLTQAQTIAGLTTAATRIVSSGGTSAIKYLYSAGAGTAGTPCSCGVWVQNLGSVTVTLSNNVGASDTVAPGAIKFARMQTASVGAASRLLQFAVPTSADVLNVLAFAPQIEVLATCTTFTSGTRAASGILPFPVSPAPWDAFTVCGWIRAGSTTGTRSVAGSWGGSGTAADSDWTFGVTAATSLQFSWYDASGVLQSLSATGLPSDMTTGYVHVAATYHRGTATARIYTGGVLRASSLTAAMHAPYAGTFGFGTAGGGNAATPLNGLLGPMWVLPYDATQAQIQALASLTSAPPALPAVRVTGDIVRGVPTTMTGSITAESDLLPVSTPTGAQWYESLHYGLREWP